MCIRNLDGETLKKLLVHGIEKVLLLREVNKGCSGALNCTVEGSQFPEEFGAVIGVLCKRVNHIFNFACDDISACKIAIVKDSGEDFLCQEVLDEHLLYSGFSEVGVNRLLTVAVEVRKCLLKPGVGVLFFLDQRRCAFAECWHFVLEFNDGAFPIGDICLFITEESVKRPNKRFWVSDAYIHNLLLILIEDSAFLGCKEDVILWIACIEFLSNGGGKIIVEVLRFPVAARQAEVIIGEHTINVNYGILQGSERFFTDKR